MDKGRTVFKIMRYVNHCKKKIFFPKYKNVKSKRNRKAKRTRKTRNVNRKTMK